MFGFSSFSESPYSALPLNSYQFQCEAGSYTLTGATASFSYVRNVAAGVGSYSLTGIGAGLHNDKVLQGNAGAYALTANDARLDYDQILRADGGSYALSGNSASFATGKSLFAGAFSFLINGQQANLLQTSLLNAEPGSYVITGGEATFAKGKTLLAGAGNYEFIGYSADLVYSGQPAVVMPSKGGVSKKKKTKTDIDREQREELEALVKREFDILDGTYIPEAVEAIKQQLIPQFKEIDWTEYQIALAQVNALLLKAKIQIAEYESELDDEESLLMLL